MKKYYLFLTALFFALIQAKAQYNIEVTINTDNYAEETTWDLSDGNSELLSGGPYANDLTGYTQDVNVGEGDYEFTIYDSANDGICCGFGLGSYTIVETVSGATIAEGGEFGGSETVSFALPFIAPVLGCTDPEAINYDPEADENDGSCSYLLNPLQIELEEFADGFDDPIDISHAGDDRLFIAEKDGAIWILNPDGTTNSTPFLNISSLTNGGGERGLLGMEFHPNFAQNRYFYLNYTNNAGNSRIVRYTVDASNPNVADPNSALTILSQSQPYSNHNAGDLKFGPDGYLYIPFGDGGSGGDPDNYSQNTQSLLGKMLRIDVDSAEPYAVPSDNPFVGTTSTLDEIWSIGLRNTWRFSFDVLTGDMWMADVGQNAFEEINFEPAGSAGGLNYGWRCTEGFSNFNTSGCGGLVLEDPVSAYSHAGGACSVTGGYVYRGEEYPAMYGQYIYVDYCNGQFKALSQNAAEEWVSVDITGTLGFGWTAFGEDYLNELYVCNADGNIYRVKDLCADHTASIQGGQGTLMASEGDSYTWLFNGEILEGENNQFLDNIQSGTYAVVVELSNGCSAISEDLVFNGIGENEFTKITISPNPVSDYLSVTINKELELSDVLIYNVIGDVVMKVNQNTFNNKIDVSALQNGMYFLEIRSDVGNIRSRFLVKR